MVTRILQTLIALACLCLIAQQALAGEPGSLVRYSFDDQNVESGPDTFHVFENAKGSVSLSNDFRFSGFQSVHIEDAVGDKDFPELQGYFPRHDKGKLYIHFAMMITNPGQEFNIALAGPEGFSLKKDGIGFWMHSKQGYLHHVSDSIHKKLFPLQEFTWYIVDIVYNLDDGRYDLNINQEHQDTPLVALKSAPNATLQAHSAVSKFSFIGDLRDKYSVSYYVDDIELNSHKPVASSVLLAPGRRKLFIDYWNDFQHKQRKHPVCIPTTFYTDFGFSQYDLKGEDKNNLLTAIKSVIKINVKSLDKKLIQNFDDQPKLQSVIAWRLGCKSLADKKPRRALEWFEIAEESNSNARLIPISKALALAAAGRHDAAMNVMYEIVGQWAGDERYAAAQAMLGLARGDIFEVSDVLQQVVESWPLKGGDVMSRLWDEGPDKELLALLKKDYPDYWERFMRNYLLAQQYYYLLLLRGEYQSAYDFAGKTLKTLQKKKVTAVRWMELQANAAFLMNDLDVALGLYENALSHVDNKPHMTRSIFLKMSDVFFKKGDIEQERAYREFVYGTLK